VLAAAGATAAIVALFLPFSQNPGTFSSIQDHTLAQHSDGIAIAVLALSGAIAAYRAFRARRRTVSPLILALPTLGLFIVNAARKTSQDLYPVGADGQPDTSQAAVHASLVELERGAITRTLGGVRQQRRQVATHGVLLLPKL